MRQSILRYGKLFRTIVSRLAIGLVLFLTQFAVACNKSPVSSAQGLPSQKVDSATQERDSLKQKAEQKSEKEVVEPETPPNKESTHQADELPLTEQGEEVELAQEEDDKLIFEIEGDADGIVRTEQIWQKVLEQAGADLKKPLMKRRMLQSIDLSRPRARWLVRGIDFALRPAIRLSLNGDGTGIVVEIDKTEVEKIKASMGESIRNVGATASEWNSEPYGLKVVHENRTADRTVVIVHGFNSSPEPFGNVVELLQTTDSQIATFYYPSQLGVTSAAERLSNDLKSFSADNPEQSITILSHSMGGLCSRFVIESEEFDCTAVDRLIMVATPNHGTEIAQPGLTGEVFDGVFAQIDRPKIASTLKSIVTEINYGLKDLEPNSQLLRQLNALPRNPRVSYHILLGNKAPLTREQIATATKVVKRIKSNIPAANLAAQHMADTLQQLSNEIAKPNGDGVVSVASGELPGVEDIEVLEFSHNDICASESEGWEILKDEILERLVAAED